MSGPKKVETYNCSYCGLISLEGAPISCKNFICNYNDVTFTEEEVRKYIKDVQRID